MAGSYVKNIYYIKRASTNGRPKFVIGDLRGKIKNSIIPTEAMTEAFRT